MDCSVLEISSSRFQLDVDDVGLNNIESKMEDKMGQQVEKLSNQLHDCQGLVVKLLQEVLVTVRALDRASPLKSPLGQSAHTPMGVYKSEGAGSARQSYCFQRTGADKSPTTPTDHAVEPTVTFYNSEMVPLLTESEQPGITAEMMEAHNKVIQQKLKAAQESMRQHKPKQSTAVRQVAAFLEDPDSSYSATYYNYFIVSFNMFGIWIGLLPFADMRLDMLTTDLCNFGIDGTLLLETVVRALFYPNSTKFLTSATNIIDLSTIIPLVVIIGVHLDFRGSIFNLWADDFLLAAIPIIRFLRLIRRFPKMQILFTAFMNCVEALPVLLYTMAIMACIFTSALYFAEPRDNIHSMCEAAWLVLSTMTTVGYGDVVPTSRLGTFFTSVLMIVSPLYMAMPFGIIGYSFTEIWGRRQQILLLQGTRDRLGKFGFGAFEMPKLFALFDLDNSEEIDLNEFLLMLKELEIGFREDDIIELFNTIDKDAGGTIDEKEFVKTLYPAEYRYMYGKKKVGEMLSELHGDNDRDSNIVNAEARASLSATAVARRSEAAQALVRHSSGAAVGKRGSMVL